MSQRDASGLVRHRELFAAGGFTLLEVLVALAILGIAVVSFIELSSRSLRLIKSSGDYQHAVELADRIATQTDPTEEGVDTGQEGLFKWERSIALVQLPEEFQPAVTIPGKEPPKLYAVKVDVSWGGGQLLEVATLRTPTTPPAATGQPAGSVQPQGSAGVQPGVGTHPGTGTQQTGSPGANQRGGLNFQPGSNIFSPRGPMR
jgi:prepilin-type N-terminal cleavage/methylation domain-containing protein